MSHGSRPGRPAASWRDRPFAVKALIGLLVGHGVSAIGGGGAMAADPLGRTLGWDTSMLGRTPFTSYLWPGLILALGLGLTSLVIALGVVTRARVSPLGFVERWTGQHWSWTGCIGLGFGLAAWILVQLSLIDDRSFLQPLMLGVGVALVVLPLLPQLRQDLKI